MLLHDKQSFSMLFLLCSYQMEFKEFLMRLLFYIMPCLHYFYSIIFIISQVKSLHSICPRKCAKLYKCCRAPVERLRSKISVQPGRCHYAFSNKYVKTVIFHEKNICIYVTTKQFTIIIYVVYHRYIKYIVYKKK